MLTRGIRNRVAGVLVAAFGVTTGLMADTPAYAAPPGGAKVATQARRERTPAGKHHQAKAKKHASKRHQKAAAKSGHKHHRARHAHQHHRSAPGRAARTLR
jgi:hypothetical protein